MSGELQGKTVAIVATDGVEQAELTEPMKALRAAGAAVHVVAPAAGTIQGMNHDEKGDALPVNRTLDQARPGDYQALVLPGGVANPDRLRTMPRAIAFVRAFVDSNKPVAAICHGPWTLIEADAVKGRVMTSWPSLKTDLENAGARWVDREVVVDHGLVTSRKPADLPAFCTQMVETFRAGGR
jgi:protease I